MSPGLTGGSVLGLYAVIRSSAMASLGDLLLSCWLIETGRSVVLEQLGHDESARRAAERARIIAKACADEGMKIRPDLARGHAEWMAEVAGSPEDTGALGWFFLQRLGNYVELHVAEVLDEAQKQRMIDLGAPDAEAVSRAIGEQGLPPAPPLEWPEAEPAKAPGQVLAKIGMIGDPHIGLAVSDQMIPAAIEDINREQVDFSFIVGDLTQNGEADLFIRAREIFDRLDSEYLLTLGNHDMWGFGGSEAVGLDRFKTAFQREPYGVKEVGGARMILLNSANPEGSPFPPYDLTAGGFSADPPESVPGGVISDEVADWMRGIAAGPPTLIALHHPPHPYLGFPPLIFGLDEKSTSQLAEFVERIGAWGVICGHTHRSVVYEFAGRPFLEVISSKEWPFGYGIVEISDEGWSYNLKPVSAKELVEEASARASVLLRRYSRGPDEARAFSYRA